MASTMTPSLPAQDTPPPKGPLASGWLYVVCLNLVLIASYYALTLAEMRGHQGLFLDENDIVGRDFVNIWTAAKLTLHGAWNLIYNLHDFHATQESLFDHTLLRRNWSYPPHLLPWIMGFGKLPYDLSCVIWLGLTFAACAVAVTAGRTHGKIWTTILALSPAAYANVMAGQNGFLTAACLIGGLRLLPTSPIVSGILFGFLTTKPQLAALVPIALIAGRHGKALVVMGATTLALVALSLRLFGLEPWVDYITEALPYQRHLLEIDTLYAFSAMMPTPFMAVRHLGGSVDLAYGVAALFALPAALAVITAFAPRSSMPMDHRIVVLAASAFLVVPYAMSYDMPILAAAMIGLFATSSRPLTPGPGSTTLLTALWILPVCLIMLNYEGFPLGPLLLVSLVLYMQRLQR